MPTLPSAMLPLLLPFAPLLNRRVWPHALVVVVGTILALGKRTVCAALRAMGLRQARHWTSYRRRPQPGHVVEPRRRPRAARAAGRGERGDRPAGLRPRRDGRAALGARIAAKGLYRDAARSSKGSFVKVRGLRWLWGRWTKGKLRYAKRSRQGEVAVPCQGGVYPNWASGIGVWKRQDEMAFSLS